MYAIPMNGMLTPGGVVTVLITGLALGFIVGWLLCRVWHLEDEEEE